MNFQRLIVRSISCLFILSSFWGGNEVIAQTKALGLPFSYHIEPKEYAAGMQNLDIEQDSRGFMYLANNFGLLEFDGANWKTYPVLDGSKVRSISITDKGLIYVAAQGEFGFFKPDDISSLSYHSLSKDLPEEHRNFDEVWKVFEGSNEVYFCTFSKIFVYYQNQLADVISIPESHDFFFINNRLYAQTIDIGFQILFNGNLNEIANFNLKRNEAVISTIKDSENSVLFITNQGRVISSSGGVKFDIGNQAQFNTPINLTKAIRLSSGNIAIGTEQHGLIIIDEDGNTISHLTKNSGLNSRSVSTMLEDLDGNLWVARNNGISVIELGLPFSYINEDFNLPGSGYDAYSNSERLYLATNYGLYSSKMNNSTLSFELVNNTAGLGYSVSEINNKIIFGGGGGGYLITGDNGELISGGDGMWKVTNDPLLGNKIIAGTYTGLELYEDRGTSVERARKIPGLDESSRVMEFDEYGHLWMTQGYKGVFRIEFASNIDSVQKLSYYGTEDGLPSSQLVNVFKIDDKLLFTSIDGIYQFDYLNNKFYKDTVDFSNEELNQPINLLAEDGNSNIYYLAVNNMGVIQKDHLGNYQIQSNIFNKVFGQLNDDLLNISIINSNNIFFGAKDGYIIYNPLEGSSTEILHRTFVREVRIGINDSVLYSGNYIPEAVSENQDEVVRPEISYSLNSLNISFSSNFLNDYKETEYSYFLEGFDGSWSNWTKNNTINYTNLFEGDYTFHVKAKNIFNEESAETNYVFTIRPPWYRSSFAFSGYGIVLIGSFLVGFVFIDQRYRKSKKQFETKKQLEVDELGEQLESLSQTTSAEINQLKAEKLESEVDLKNTELAASTMNLIHKNKFISHIKDNLNSITKKSKSAEVKKELAVIMKDIDKNISHDDDWQQFTFHFNNVHGDFTTRLTHEFNNLSSQDIRLCSYLRLNLSTKEIADLLNISVRGVEISRYRLRKKLQLDRSQNLAEFILNY